MIAAGIAVALAVGGWLLTRRRHTRVDTDLTTYLLTIPVGDWRR